MNNSSTQRIVDELRSWISTAPPGAKVLSSRELMARYGASPVTVQKAMHTLTALGLVESRPGVGTFVRALRPRKSADYSWQTSAMGSPHVRLPVVHATQRSAAPDAISLHSGYPDRELLPERLVHAALNRAARTDTALTRSPVRGLPELQAWFAAELGAAAPVDISPPTARDVLVLSGSQSGMSSIFRAVVGPGEPLLIESPSYWGAILAAAQAGVTLVPIPCGPDGPDPEDVDRAFRQSGARAFYAQPTYANPTGIQWSPQRGKEILGIVRNHGAFLIEDDWAHDLAIDTDPRPLAAHDDSGHVIYVRSLTKSVSPALRVAAVIARGPVLDRIVADRGAEALYVSGLLQAAALDVVTQSGWKTYQRGLRHQLRDRRDLLVESLRAHTPDASLERIPAGGLNLWLRLPDGTDLDRLVRDCEASGLIIAAGDDWFPAEPAGPFIRLNYSGSAPERFPEATRILQSALDQQRGN
ncbi:PLP-dependent aminotransferase family protein [Paeniglutamicibacter terrestris]|uniref:PLP-dependent aminotransferase family protein n=1 Tax=Paeniglutamicibacter terrestris TaxID=2723403 RepID=A0ABX1G5C1_9MICC|nr:PLP-dependent aminotransferase family protein [Paeniglutamicibacter terrestris]ASN39218.1 GntR family transcriptional regulator [Arthrobacter sp. 7749]NKG20786.1 PLP-dependent aminotransferase family protein [Paeniglutamicibacter terrestris]